MACTRKLRNGHILLLQNVFKSLISNLHTLQNLQLSWKNHTYSVHTSNANRKINYRVLDWHSSVAHKSHSKRFSHLQCTNHLSNKAFKPQHIVRQTVFWLRLLRNRQMFLENLTVVHCLLFQPTLQHWAICRISYSEDMGWHFMPFLSFVHFHHTFGVNWKLFVWIHHHAEQSRICLKRQKTLLRRLSIHSDGPGRRVKCDGQGI